MSSPVCITSHLLALLRCDDAKETNITHRHREKRPGQPPSQALSGDEDEETADSRCQDQEHDHDGERAPNKRLPDKLFPDLVEVEERVLAVSEEGNDRVEHVLVCEDEVDGDCEGQNDLGLMLVASIRNVE
jgi:hypothetical protein